MWICTDKRLIMKETYKSTMHWSSLLRKHNGASKRVIHDYRSTISTRNQYVLTISLDSNCATWICLSNCGPFRNHRFVIITRLNTNRKGMNLFSFFLIIYVFRFREDVQWFSLWRRYWNKSIYNCVTIIKFDLQSYISCIYLRLI